jgi:hypothetical protein
MAKAAASFSVTFSARPPSTQRENNNTHTMGGDAPQPAKKGGVSADMTVSDSRFKGLHNDPRFMSFPASHQKVKIDKRFEKMFNDPNFSTGAKGGKTDKRGRRTDKAAKASQGGDLKEYYQLDDEEGGAGGEGGDAAGGGGKDERFAKKASFAAAAADDDAEESDEESESDEEDVVEESEKARQGREKDELEAQLEVGPGCTS